MRVGRIGGLEGGNLEESRLRYEVGWRREFGGIRELKDGSWNNQGAAAGGIRSAEGIRELEEGILFEGIRQLSKMGAGAIRGAGRGNYIWSWSMAFGAIRKLYDGRGWRRGA